MKAFSALMANLQSHLSGSRIIPPTAQTIKRYAAHDITPMATLQCVSMDDAQTAVKFCNEHEIEFVVKASGINQACHSIRPNALVLDHSGLNGISHSLESNRLRVNIQAGTNFRQLQQYLNSFNTKNKTGFHVTLADDRRISCIGSHTVLGNGLSQQMCGIGVDFIKQAKVLMANGEIITANQRENLDLLWGIKGCGTNLGVILQISEQLPERCNCIDPNGSLQIRKREYSFPISAANIGNELSILIDSVKDTVHPEIMFFKNNSSSSICININQMLYSKQHQKIILDRDEFVDKLMKDMCLKYDGTLHSQKYLKMIDTGLHESEFGQSYYYICGGLTSSAFLPEIIQEISSFYSTSSHNMFKQDHVNLFTAVGILKSKAFDQRDPESTSVPISKADDIFICGNVNFKNKENDFACYKYLKTLQGNMKKFLSAGSLADFNKRDINDNPQLGKWIFGKNYARLKQIKQKYDPNNKFNYGLF